MKQILVCFLLAVALLQVQSSDSAGKSSGDDSSSVAATHRLTADSESADISSDEQHHELQRQQPMASSKAADKTYKEKMIDLVKSMRQFHQLSPEAEQAILQQLLSRQQQADDDDYEVDASGESDVLDELDEMKRNRLDKRNRWDKRNRLDKRNRWDKRNRLDKRNRWDKRNRLDKRNRWDKRVPSAARQEQAHQFQGDLYADVLARLNQKRNRLD